MRWSIRYQLLVPLLVILLGIVGISTWAAVSSARRAARQQIEMLMREQARTLSEARIPLKDVLQQVKGLSGADYVLVAPDGTRSSTLPATPTESLPADVVSDHWQELRLGPSLTVGGQKYLCSGVRLRESRADADSTLYILYPEARWRGALWSATWPSLLLGLLGSMASGALAVWVAHRLSRRIQELEQRTRLIAAGDFSPMPLPGLNDELRDLGVSVNEMAQRLAQLQEAVQKAERLRLLGQVGGGLAHQLRNSVTGARLAVQLHVQDCNGRADAEALEVALRQLTFMEERLRRFLDLGRTGDVRREPCALGNLIDEAVSLLRPQCRHAHIDLRWQRPGRDLTVLGDADQLAHLLVNVIGNAIEAAGPGGHVEVTVHKKEGTEGCLIEVADSGLGPPPEIAARLFEPFVTSKRDGIGLGLAVAQEVAKAHGGSIHWRREENRTCFRIELPLAAVSQTPSQEV